MELNSFTSAVDNHNIANGDKSWLEQRTDATFEFLSDIPEAIVKGGTGAVVAGVNSVLNSGIAVANFVGADIEPISTYETLKSLDDNLADYYKNHESGVEIGGFILGSFVPGMAGVKAFQAARAGFVGTNVARSSGLLTSLTRDYATAAKLEFATGSSPFTLLNQNVIKSLAQGAGGAALEAGAFEMAVAGTMFKSPVLDGQSISDLVWNGMTGVLIGGGIGGVLHGVATTYGIKKAVSKTKEELFPYTHIAELDESASSDLKLISYFQQRNNIPDPAVPSGGFKELDAATGLELQAKEAEKTKERIDILIRKEFNRYAGGDEKIGNQLFEKFKDQDNLQEIIAGLLHSKGASRITENEKLVVGDVLFPKHNIPKEEFQQLLKDGKHIELLTDTATKGTQGFRVVGDLSNLKVTGAGEAISSGARIGNREVAFEQGYDLFRNNNGTFSVNPTSKILAASSDRRIPNNLIVDFEQGGTIVDKATPGLSDLATKARPVEVRGNTVLAGDVDPIKIGNKFDPLEDDYLKVQARYIWAQNQKNMKFEGRIIDANDFPLLEQALWQNGKDFRIRLEDGQVVSGPEGQQLKDFLYQEKSKFTQKLNGKPMDELELRLNVTSKWLQGERDEIAKIRPGVSYDNPRYARIDYPDAINALDTYNAGHVDGAISYQLAVQTVKQRHIQNFTNYAGAMAERFPEAPNWADPGRTPTGAPVGAGIATFSNSAYGSAGAWAEGVGPLTNALKVAKKTETVQALNDIAARVNTPALRSELDLVTNRLRSSPEAFVFHPTESTTLIPRKDFQAVNKGMQPSETIKMGEEVSDFLRAHSILAGKRQPHIDNLRGAAGLMNDTDLAVVYAPPINTSKYKNFAFVEPNEMTVGGRKRVIVAKDEATLSSLIDQVDRTEFRVYTKQESEEWHKAIGDYDFQLGLNESLVDST
jgi:hypothetical protein